MSRKVTDKKVSYITPNPISARSSLANETAIQITLLYDKYQRATHYSNIVKRDIDSKKQ